MSIALDLGAYRLRSLRRRGPRVVGRSHRAAYALLEDAPSHRRVLERSHIPYGVCEDSLVLMGDAADEYAASFRTPGLPLLPNSRVPASDPPARQVLATLIDALLPPRTETGEVCFLTVPGSADDTPPARRTRDFATRLVRLAGYEPHVLARGTAAVLASLVETSFTGIGIDFGGGTTDVAVVHRGTEVARTTLSRGGDWLDERLARELELQTWDAKGHRYLDLAAARRWKESRVNSLLQPADDRERFLGEIVTELLATTLERAGTVLHRSPAVAELPRPLPVVCTGGLTALPGFETLLNEVRHRVEFPFTTGELRIVGDGRGYDVARGCLISAEIEAEVGRRSRSAA